MNHFKESVVEGPDLAKLARAQAQLSDLSSGQPSLEYLENPFADGHPDSNYKAIKSLQGIRQRRDILEQTIQHQSKEKLMELLTFVGDDKVEILGEKKSLEEAVQAVGVSSEDFGGLKKFHENSEFYQQALKMMKLEYGVGSDLQE